MAEQLPPVDCTSRIDSDSSIRTKSYKNPFLVTTYDDTTPHDGQRPSRFIRPTYGRSIAKDLRFMFLQVVTPFIRIIEAKVILEYGNIDTIQFKDHPLRILG